VCSRLWGRRWGRRGGSGSVARRTVCWRRWALWLSITALIELTVGWQDICFGIVKASEALVGFGLAYALHRLACLTNLNVLYRSNHIIIIIDLSKSWGISSQNQIDLPHIPSHIPFDPYFNFSNSPISTTLNSLLAHNTTLSTNPGRYPPPTITPSLHVRPCHNSSSASIPQIAPFTLTIHCATRSVTSSLNPGTLVRSRLVSGCACVGTFHPFPVPFFKSSLFNTLILTGGRGRKYSVYALARKLDIANRVGRSVERRPRSGRWKSAGARGRMVRSAV
jgi:hypothetical protein